MGFCVWPQLCLAVLSVPSSFAIISLGKRVLVTLLWLPSYCHVVVGVLCLPHGDMAIGTASANSAKFHGFRPRMYSEDLL